MKLFAVNFLAIAFCACVSASQPYQTVTIEPLSLTAETNDPANISDTMRAYLEVQSQLHATQLSLQRNQEEAAAQAVHAARELEDRINQLEKSHERELQMAQGNNRVILILAGTFAGMGFLAMLLTGYFQWRAINRITEIVVATRGEYSAAAGWEIQQTGGESQVAVQASSESTMRLLGVVDRLEQRILQLEQMTHSPVQDSPALSEVVSGSHATPSADHTARITLLLGKGQSLLNLEKSDDAIACFDEILKLDENNTEALVKKGVALERLRKLNEAIECYDRAIAADDSMTIAYLYKGGVFNRLERFDEALACYEKALHSQENGNGATN